MMYQDWDLNLNGDRVRITPLSEKDEEAYGRLMLGYDFYDAFEQRNGFRFNTGLHKTLSHQADDEEHAIRLANDDRFIGWITLQKNHDGQPDIGISLIPECRNHGYGPEAVKLFANYLYQTYGLEQVSVRIEKTNTQSQRAFVKLGAVFEREAVLDLLADLKKEPAFASIQFNEPIVYYYHIPLPVTEINSDDNVKDRSEDQKSGCKDDGIDVIKANCIGILDELSNKIESKKKATVSDVKQIISELQKSLFADDNSSV